MTRQVLAFGGGVLTEDGAPLRDFLLELTGRPRPRLCFVPTASADDPRRIATFYEVFGTRRAELSHLLLFPWPRPDLREFVLAQDAIYVGGGNTANLLALWRVHRLDAILREAWERGAVLSGSSAGMLCWFEAGVTDSFGPQLEGLRDGLGLLPGSACPHFDGEPLRRPRYHELVRAGFPPGLAADDGVGLHFVERELREVVSAREGATAYRIELVDGEVREHPLEARRAR